MSLSIHAVGDGSEERDYAAQIRHLAAGEPRITIEEPVPRQQLALTLARASALAVPSLWLETGPLVVLEAKAAGLPIIGSRLGGIAELVREPEDGVLVPPGDVTAWAQAISAMASNRPARLSLVRQGRFGRCAKRPGIWRRFTIPCVERRGRARTPVCASR